jgi:DNA-binding transcriptional regulator of glucitol operon
VRQRWLSKRAFGLHLAVVVWVPACLLAGWWQVNRAFDGNGLSYLYSVEWPIFALLGIWGWWVFIHTDSDHAGATGQRQLKAAAAEHESEGTEIAPTGSMRQPQDEDEELADYNDRLAALAERGPKTWRNT